MGLCGCDGGNGSGGVNMATSSLVGSRTVTSRAPPPHPAAAPYVGLRWDNMQKEIKKHTWVRDVSCLEPSPLLHLLFIRLSWSLLGYVGAAVEMAVLLAVTWKDVVVDTSVSSL